MMTIRLEVNERLVGLIDIVNKGALSPRGDWVRYEWRASMGRPEQVVTAGELIHRRGDGAAVLASLALNALARIPMPEVLGAEPRAQRLGGRR